jgi:hypothetical protein
MAALHKAGHLKHWVQQNHDGLPQKAGFPPECLNEIHGAWFDPSNPVVPMSGTLRDDLIEWMEQWETTTDLCIAMGTSLCGMNADRMVETVARKAARTRNHGTSRWLGSVVVGLQRTAHDEDCSLRFYCKCDELTALLARQFGLLSSVRPLEPYQPSLPADAILRCTGSAPTVFKIPYDAKGNLTADTSSHQPWDLRDGAFLRITNGPGKGYIGSIIGRSKEGHFRCKFPCTRENSKDQGKKWQIYLLGQWWLETAIHGKAATLPIVNTDETPFLPNVPRTDKKSTRERPKTTSKTPPSKKSKTPPRSRTPPSKPQPFAHSFGHAPAAERATVASVVSAYGNLE